MNSQDMLFVRNDALDIRGTCFLRSVNTTYEQVVALFGELDDSNHWQWPKYGKDWRLLHKPTQKVFTVYRCEGTHWRIGGQISEAGAEAVEALAAMLEVFEEETTS